jgi:excisionase family DNA binding protein
MQSQSFATVLLNELDGVALRELATRLRPYLHSEPDFLDARQAAARLGLHPETLARMARDGRVPAVKVGREWRFRSDRLDVQPVAGTSSISLSAARRQRSTATALPSVSAIRGAS